MTTLVRIGCILAAVLVGVATLAACSPLAALNAFARTDTYRPSADIAYGALPRQKLDVYTPTVAAPPAGWPVVVFFYGGTWTSGERRDYKFMGEALAERGILAVVADYRLYPEVRYPEFLRDSALAVAWALDNATRLGGDPARVFVMGHSAGGYNAAMVALDPRWLAPTGHSAKELAAWIGLWPVPTSSFRSSRDRRRGPCSSIPTTRRGPRRSTTRRARRCAPSSPHRSTTRS